jgi:hypothetical protein
MKKIAKKSKEDFTKQSKKTSGLKQKSLQPQKAEISIISEMLTPSEIEQLRQELKEDIAYLEKPYSHLKPPVK